MAPKAAAKKAAPQGYIQNLRAPVETRVGAAPNVKVCAGHPPTRESPGT